MYSRAQTPGDAHFRCSDHDPWSKKAREQQSWDSAAGLENQQKQSRGSNLSTLKVTHEGECAGRGIGTG